MIDLKITNNGDLELCRNKMYPDMRIRFFVSPYPGLRLRFLQGEEFKEKTVPAGTAKISFRTKRLPAYKGISVPLITKRKEIRQRIMVRLRTEYGDIVTKPDFGSEIVTLKHKDINSEEVQQMLHDIVLDQVSDILKNPGVTVVPEKYDGDFYCQNLNIYIFDDKKLIYQFGIRG